MVRAGIQRPDMVAALGIRLQPYMTAIVMLGVGMAALGGAFFAPITIVHPAMGAEIITVAFVVVVIGGLGSFWGVVLAALLVGVVQGHHHPFRPGRRRSLDLRPDVPGAAGAPARPARRAYREVRMTAASHLARYRPLLTGRARRWSRCRSRCSCSGLSLNTGIMVVALAIAAMGLNLCVGYTGLVSFGHGAWFGIGAYAAGLDAAATGSATRSGCRCCCRWSSSLSLSTFVGFVILRRRGVYFSLLTLALAALTYTIAFRWTDVTGGEDGLGGLKRGSIGPFNLDNALTYYIVVALIGLGVLYLLLRARALAVRPCAGGDPREPVARHVPGLSGRALQARRVRDLGRRDRLRRRADRIPELPGFGRSGIGAVLRRIAGDRRDRRHAQHAGAGARRAVLHPVPRAVFDLDAELAAVVRADLRRLRAVFAGRAGRHLGDADAGAGGRRRKNPPR